MPRFQVASIDDQRLAPYRDLPRSKQLRQSGLFVVEGRWLVERLLESKFAVESLLVAKGHDDEIAAKIGATTPILVAESDLLDQIVGFSFHRGMLAVGRRRPEMSVDEVLSQSAVDDRLPRTMVACAGVCDQENLGGILRNCAAFGATVLLVDARCADPFSRRALRVSMGAAFQVPVVESTDLLGDLDRLRRRRQFELAATVLSDDATVLASFRRPQRLAIVLGGEGAGLDDDLIARCDHRVTIPMHRGTDSLNVAVAAGIFLHHICGDPRQSG